MTDLAARLQLQSHDEPLGRGSVAMLRLPSRAEADGFRRARSQAPERLEARRATT